ncbi:MAG TPA: hypothetical protein PLD49_08630, partial [Thermoclostridium caenicola]|uniref:hypothetical protein n=1 Tax=Thermoclostridium caenicola TaxID=659425 RepID=UPI002D0EC869
CWSTEVISLRHPNIYYRTIFLFLPNALYDTTSFVLIQTFTNEQVSKPHFSMTLTDATFSTRQTPKT